MWRILIPPRVHIFLWLLANNKILTRDNLAKRRREEDDTCMFYSEKGVYKPYIFSMLCSTSFLGMDLLNFR
jgi:hypothetical protein